jgi:hypothetical protein
MSLLGSPIKHDEVYGEVEGAEDVRYGLDAMASALTEWKDLDAGPLDEVLAELDCDDTLVETAARLIELLGRATYEETLGYDDVRKAEGLRERLVEALDDLLTQLKVEEHEDSDA